MSVIVDRVLLVDVPALAMIGNAGLGSARSTSLKNVVPVLLLHQSSLAPPEFFGIDIPDWHVVYASREASQGCCLTLFANVELSDLSSMTRRGSKLRLEVEEIGNWIETRRGSEAASRS